MELMRRHGLGWPRKTLNDFEATGIDMLKALPDHRWQSVQ
jgi:hypothetical protein